MRLRLVPRSPKICVKSSLMYTTWNRAWLLAGRPYCPQRIGYLPNQITHSLTQISLERPFEARTRARMAGMGRKLPLWQLRVKTDMELGRCPRYIVQQNSLTANRALLRHSRSGVRLRVGVYP